MEPAFTQMTVLAPGLLGGSLAIGARQRGLVKRIHVWARRPEVREKCRQQYWCDAAFETPEEAVAGSDLVVICTPVETIHRLARRVAGSLREGAVVTDVGSTKGRLCRLIEAIMPPGRHFVGSHPMAGSEKSGMEFASGTLFETRTCFVTPVETTDPVSVAKIAAFWKALGMEIVTLPPEKHDEIVANISHLPHFTATILCNWLAHGNSDWKGWAGQGLRDTTRVASGSPDMWRAICEENRDEILRALEGFASEFSIMRKALEDRNYDKLFRLFESGKAYRDSMSVKPCKNTELVHG
jgi:prephenate dehydrogenase